MKLTQIHTAHLVLFIDESNLRITHAGVFSEATPTTRMDHRPVSICEIESASYADAEAQLRLSLLDPTWAWLLPIFESGRG